MRVLGCMTGTSLDAVDRAVLEPDGESSGAVLVFWVPRAIWPDKPTMMGYWLPRAFYYDGYFAEGFSAAQGFCGNAYMDFGFWGAVLFWFVSGLGLGLLERWVASICASPRDAILPLLWRYSRSIFGT